MTCVVWAGDSKTGLEIKIGPRRQKLWHSTHVHRFPGCFRPKIGPLSSNRCFSESDSSYSSVQWILYSKKMRHALNYCWYTWARYYRAHANQLDFLKYIKNQFPNNPRHLRRVWDLVRRVFDEANPNLPSSLLLGPCFHLFQCVPIQNLEPIPAMVLDPSKPSRFVRKLNYFTIDTRTCFVQNQHILNVLRVLTSQTHLLTANLLVYSMLPPHPACSPFVLSRPRRSPCPPCSAAPLPVCPRANFARTF